MYTRVRTHKHRPYNRRMQCEQWVHNAVKMANSSWGHGTPESLHREENSWSKFWKFSFCCIGKTFLGEGAFFTEAWLQLFCVFRKERAVWHDWSCGWAIRKNPDSVSNKTKRFGASWDISVDCHSGDLWGLEVRDAVIIFVSSNDYCRKKNVQGLLGTKLEPDGCRRWFLQQPQWENVWPSWANRNGLMNREVNYIEGLGGVNGGKRRHL